MKAAVLNQSRFEFELRAVALPVLAADDDVLVRIKAASLNHHELWSNRERRLVRDSIIIPGRMERALLQLLGGG